MQLNSCGISQFPCHLYDHTPFGLTPELWQTQLLSNIGWQIYQHNDLASWLVDIFKALLLEEVPGSSQ
jgi:hypothetical protein